MHSLGIQLVQSVKLVVVKIKSYLSMAVVKKRKTQGKISGSSSKYNKLTVN